MEVVCPHSVNGVEGNMDGLNQAMEYIEHHLREEVKVAELARIAQTSEYHFRRMFSTLAGMPLSEYVRRRRLTSAGARLMSGEGTLLDIAVDHGYGSVEAFTRAFRALNGVGPQEVRQTGVSIRSQPRLTFHLTLEGSDPMDYRIVEKDAFHVVGFSRRVPLVYEGPNPAIEEFIRGLDKEAMARVAQLSDQEPRGVVAVVDNLAGERASAPEGTELDYYQGVIASEPAEEYGDLAVAPGTWAVFERSGPVPESIQYLWRDIYTQWFPSNPYRSVPGPELLRTELSEDGTQGTYAVWIPVERED